MQTQHEITKAIPLLDANGDLTEPGYARKLLPVYRRGDIRAGKLRIKEWDYYLVSNGRFALALTIDDNSYMSLDSISFLDLGENAWSVTKSPMGVLPMGKVGLPETSAVGSVSHGGKDYSISFENKGDGVRTLTASMKNFTDGKEIFAHSYDTQNVMVDVSSLRSGSYLLVVSDGKNHVRTVKLLKK